MASETTEVSISAHLLVNAEATPPLCATREQPAAGTSTPSELRQRRPHAPCGWSRPPSRSRAAAPTHLTRSMTMVGHRGLLGHRGSSGRRSPARVAADGLLCTRASGGSSTRARPRPRGSAEKLSPSCRAARAEAVLRALCAVAACRRGSTALTTTREQVVTCAGAGALRARLSVARRRADWCRSGAHTGRASTIQVDCCEV